MLMVTLVACGLGLVAPKSPTQMPSLPNASHTINSSRADGPPPAAPLLEAAEAPSPRQRHALPGNATAILVQARNGLSTALREVRACRSQKAQCEEELKTCRGVGATGAESMLALKHRTEEVASVAQQKLASLKLQLQQASSAGEACRQRLDKLTLESTYEEAQRGALRRKLEQKERLQEAIEDKAKQLYRTLETECQTELQQCRDGARNHDATSPAAPGSSHAADATCEPRWSGSWLLAAFGGGAVVGWAVRSKGSRAPPHGGRFGLIAQVEEMRGWMPVSTADMKIS
jgi:hypothetical protein